MLILEIGENYREICKERAASELANELTGFMTRKDAMEYGTGDTSQKEVADSFRMQLMQGSQHSMILQNPELQVTLLQLHLKKPESVRKS